VAQFSVIGESFYNIYQYEAQFQVKVIEELINCFKNCMDDRKAKNEKIII